MSRRWIDFWVGVFALISILALMFLAFQASSNRMGGIIDSYPLTVYFDDIGTLHNGSPVKASGVVIGQVQQVTFDNKRSQARVEISVAKAYQFPEDTRAIILTAGLLGERYIGVEMGFSDQVLQAGDEIRFTQSAMVLEKVVGNLVGQFASNGGSK